MFGIAILTCQALAAENPPNIVFVLADDCSYRDMALYGGPAKTPFINRLAKEGMVFDRCYQAAPMCSPTRHSLYTGLYPVKNGAHPNHARAYENIKSIPHYLSVVGYRVALAGKTHIEPKSIFPFEYLKEFADPPEVEVPLINGWRYPDVFQLMKESAQAEQPFCLFLCSNEPHGPYTKGDHKPYQDAKLSPQQLEMHRDSYANYLAEITYFDGQVGEILNMLEKLEIRRNTIVFVASEQGSSFPFGKWTCYEIGVASGLVVSWPGQIKAGAKSKAIVEYVDVVPTMIELAGGQTKSSLDGKSFLGVLKGAQDKHKTHAFSIQTTLGVNGVKEAYGIRSVVNERFRYVLNLFPENEFSIPTSRRLVEETAQSGEKERQFARRFLKRPKEELFDVLKDPYCERNLASDPTFQKEKATLASKLLDWMTEQNDQGRATELSAHERQSEWATRKRKKSQGTE